MASEWTDELKQEVVAAYVDSDPTPDTSAEIVKEIADDIDKTANGVRRILMAADVYVKKTAAKAAAATDGKSKTTKISKADAIASLTDAITKNGADVDTAILEKLTGKAAVYFTGVIAKITE